MCGIAGFWGYNMAGAEALIHRMLDTISHRGPDGRGTTCLDHACLGHVRLSIIDIEGGRQPMCTSDKRYWITYNGELYNYQEIRTELRQDGFSFQTNSDTEVVLQAFQHLGSTCLNKFRGMFAMAVWDDQKKEGFLIRDRFGIKPLFYTILHNQIIFGSEIKAILTFPQVNRFLDLDALHLLMNYRYIPGVGTMFKNIKHLPPGHLLRWHDGYFSVQEWISKPAIQTSKPSIDEIKTTLQTAIKRQLVSDVPLGSYLSAGIDSSTILALSLKHSTKSSNEFPTFTIKTGDSPLEAVNATETAHFFGVPNFQADVDTNLDNQLARLIWHLEVPKVNAYQSALVANLARKQVKVALTGVGGDEIFLGYNIHRYLDRLHAINKKIQPILLACGKLSQPLLSHMGLYFEEYARGCQALSALPDFCRIYGIIRNIWDSPDNRARIYGPRMLEHNPDNAFLFLNKEWGNNDSDPVAACAEFEIRNKMVNDLLLQEDRLSMAFGLEVRVPFLDEDLVHLVSSISSRDRMPQGNPKGLMKTIVSEWLPNNILNRPKSGFQLPIHNIFETHLKPLAIKYLSRNRLEKNGLFNYNFVASILKAKPNYRLRWHYFLLYLMIGTSIWIDIFEKNEPIPPWK